MTFLCENSNNTINASCLWHRNTLLDKLALPNMSEFRNFSIGIVIEWFTGAITGSSHLAMIVSECGELQCMLKTWCLHSVLNHEIWSQFSPLLPGTFVLYDPSFSAQLDNLKNGRSSHVSSCHPMRLHCKNQTQNLHKCSMFTSL